MVNATDILKLCLEEALREEGLDSRYDVVELSDYTATIESFTTFPLAVTLKDRESQILRIERNDDDQVRPCYAAGG